MSKIFEIDFKRLVVMLLPLALRKPLIFALLNSMIKPITTLYNNFLNSRKTNLYIATITPQVCYLRKLLNDTFDPDFRRIYISDGEINEWVLLSSLNLFNSTDDKQPLWVGSEVYQIIYKQGIVTSIGFDFAIFVPNSLRNNTNHNRIISLLDSHKLASKRYIINYF